MTIQRISQKISKGVTNFTDFSIRHLEGPVKKIIGLIAIIFGLAVIGATAFLFYKAALWMGLPKWHGAQFCQLLPCAVIALPVLTVAGLLSIPSLWYGWNMITTKLNYPENPKPVEGDL